MWMYGGKDADVFTGPGKTGGIVFHSVMFREPAEMVHECAAGRPTVAQREGNLVGDHAVGTFHRGYSERFIAWCGIGGTEFRSPPVVRQIISNRFGDTTGVRRVGCYNGK